MAEMHLQLHVFYLVRDTALRCIYLTSIIVFPPDCEQNKQRLLEHKRAKDFTEVITNFDPPKLTEKEVVIDGLFGCGINKPLSGGFASLVKYINQSPAKVVSIDIPSGLMPEDNTYNVRVNVINADLTLTLQQKKLAMLLAELPKAHRRIESS